jgi:hypothetical protein
MPDEIKIGELESQVANARTDIMSSLSEEDKEKLSKVLFPDTDTTSITLLGKSRELRPLPIKYAKIIHAKLRPLAIKLGSNAATPSEGAVDIDQDVLEGLKHIALTLADFYGWSDLAKAVDEENISIDELEALALTQANVSKANDFLLGPLRVIVRVLQVGEILQLQFASTLTTYTTPRSSIHGTVRSKT